MSIDPVFVKDGEWHFWDETWADSHGPFATEKEAREALAKYCAELNYEGDSENIS